MSQNNICKKCNVKCDSNSKYGMYAALKCVRCKNLYHTKCMEKEITIEALRICREVKNIVFMCDLCIAVNELPDPENVKATKFDELDRKIEDLRNNIGKIIQNELLKALNQNFNTEIRKSGKRRRIDDDQDEYGAKNIKSFSETVNLCDEIENPTITKNDENRKMTYADQVKQFEPEKCVVIKSKDIQMKNTDTLNKLKEKVDPKGISIERVKHVSNGAILVQCSDSTQAENIKGLAEKSLGTEFEVKTPRKFTLKMKVTGLSDDLSDLSFLQQVKEQNPELANAKINILGKYENKNYSYYKFNKIIEIRYLNFQIFK